MNRKHGVMIPCYVQKILAKGKDRQIVAGFHEVNVYHDSWCSIFSGGKCDCNPDVDMFAFPAKN